MRPLLSVLGWTESKLVILIIRSRVLRRLQREVVRGVFGPMERFRRESEREERFGGRRE